MSLWSLRVRILSYQTKRHLSDSEDCLSFIFRAAVEVCQRSDCAQLRPRRIRYHITEYYIGASSGHLFVQ